MTQYDFVNPLIQEWNRINEQWNLKSELTHVVVASSLLSFLTYFIFDTTPFGLPHSLAISFLIIAPSIMFHELMHVKAAKELGYDRARYVAYLPMLILSCIIVAFFRVPFILFVGFASIGLNNMRYPVDWYYSKIPSIKMRMRNRNEAIGFIALGGLVANVAIIAILTPLAVLLPPSPVTSIFSTMVYLNFMLLAFNMIPLPIFDGNRVFHANKRWFLSMWLFIITLGITLTLLYSSQGWVLLI